MEKPKMDKKVCEIGFRVQEGMVEWGSAVGWGASMKSEGADECVFSVCGG